MNLVQKTPNKLWMGGQVLKEVGEGDGGIRGGMVIHIFFSYVHCRLIHPTLMPEALSDRYTTGPLVTGTVMEGSTRELNAGQYHRFF